MKLKYRFIVRNVGGKPVAVAVGTDNEKFNGMVKLNASGETIFRLLNAGSITQDEIVKKLAEEYSIDMDTAEKAVSGFVDYLRANGLLEE